ncbi:tetratricopeptide repeat protein [Ferruginibacter sp. SUN106]|uniref:type IX secretion system periplasmic lipoprotein PorW/SprE n=1 Tax=Ferruginibacter sp. SUN106 TaxID=2978348 RepID=UPI003D35F7C7
MLKRTIVFTLLFVVFNCCFFKAFAQPMWTLDPFGKEKKPEKYETRKLGSEKTADKKFTNFRHVVQNNITHYNYYFNSNNKVNAVVERAKLSNKDDYSKLLPFYPYSLDNTATQKQELDSIIYKCTAGILLHDLRNDWIDNMYLLIGKAYYYRKDFDSAAMTFQFINYNLFPRKKNEDDSRVVGTNESASGSNISIANKEKRNILQKATALPPSRNDALIWLARALIEQNEFGESAGLINTLQNDANLPKRLQNDLEEVSSYWYFKQTGYDSAAVHLEKALSNADDKQDKARREFLLAQLYEMNGQTDKASDYYGKASKHTVDPLMDIYAQLNDAKMYRSGDNLKELNNSISNLLKMGRKDKFEAYRDIVYYSAAQLTMQKPDSNAAVVLFNKSIKYNENNISYKNKAYVQLGDIAYKRKQYRLAAAMYDSLQVTDTTFTDNLALVLARKAALSKIVGFITNIEREDSLQRIAALTPAERELFVKKLVKRMRKENGLKDDGSNAGSASPTFDTKNNPPADLFASNSTKGEWYFYNSALKGRGFTEFKSRWGNRANVDNWRRKAALDLNATNGTPNKNATTANNTPGGNNAGAQQPEITYEGLMQNLPLTPEKTDSSNTTISNNLLDLAQLYKDELEDYAEAIKTYEEHLQRFPNKLADGEIYLGLYYCYNKLGNTERANYYKNLLNTKFSGNKAWQKLNDPAALDPKTKNTEATKTYENVYNLFLEGKFDEAIAEKKKADAQYGVNYWTPQLLYIEALYNVKQRNDSLAIAGLNTIIQNNPNSPLKEKAATMIDVLKRRKEIETYLTNLQVTRAEDDQILIPTDTKPVVKQQAPAVKAPVLVQKPTVSAPVIKDTVVKAPPLLTNGSFVIKPDAPHTVVMILDKVDGVYVNEARNAFVRYNKENYYGQVIDITKDAIDADRNILVISSFADGAAALQYYDKIKRDAAREVSWLPANKYSFIIITSENLQVLKTNKDINGYKALLNKQYPGKF